MPIVKACLERGVEHVLVTTHLQCPSPTHLSNASHHFQSLNVQQSVQTVLTKGVHIPLTLPLFEHLTYSPTFISAHTSFTNVIRREKRSPMSSVKPDLTDNLTKYQLSTICDRRNSTLS